MSRRPPVFIVVSSHAFPMIFICLVDHEIRINECTRMGIVARLLHDFPCNELIVKASRKLNRNYLLSLEYKRNRLRKSRCNGRGNESNGIKDNRRNMNAKIITSKRKIAVPQTAIINHETSYYSSEANSPVSECYSDDSTPIIASTSNEPYRFATSRPPPKNRNVQEAAAWLRKYFPAHESTFANYSGIDLLNLTHQELIQFCGPLDGIRIYNEIIEKSPVPKLAIYCAVETDSEPIWKIVCLFERTTDALTAKLLSVFNLTKDCLHSVWLQGPRGIRVLMCNDLVSNMEKESVYLIQLLKDSPMGYFKLLLKPYGE